MNRKRFLIGVVLIVLISVAAAGCAEGGGDPIEAAAIQPSPEPTKTAVPPTDVPPTEMPPVEGYFDIGGYQLYLQCFGSGQPVVLLESGLGGASDYWLEAFKILIRETRVCRYDRAGLGRSDPSPKSPRSTADMAEDLHALLGAADVSGPFVMAGHSMGGFINLIYADTYPDEVVGIVLVDGSIPNGNEMNQQLGDEFDYEMPDFGPVYEGGEVDFELSRLEAAAVADLGDMPLVILSAADSYSNPDTPEGYDERGRELYTEAQLGYLDLSTNSRHAVVENVHHGTIVGVSYAEVAEAILDVVAQVRGE